MKIANVLIMATLVIGLASGHSFGQGARAIYIDSISGATIPTTVDVGAKPDDDSPANTTNTAAKSPDSKKPGGGQPTNTAAKNPAGKKPGGDSSTAPTVQTQNTSPAVTGLMYYVELLTPDGQLQQVNTTRVFRSGERIRLNFQSNVDGRLMLFQQQEGSSMRILHPDARVNDGDNRIRAGRNVVIPSSTDWWEFDDNPGEIRLTVFLATEKGYGSINPQNKGYTVNNDNISTQVAQVMSRGLRLITEEDNTSPKPASYAVVNQEPTDPADDGIIVLEIELNHKP